MNWCNMLFQVTFSRKSVVTNFTFERLISFMSRHNMIFQFIFSTQTLLTNFTFLSWTDATCLFNFTLLTKSVAPNFIFEQLISFINQSLMIYVPNFTTRVVTSHIWMAYFHHELMKYGVSSYRFEKICSHLNDISGVVSRFVVVPDSIEAS